MKSLYRRTIMGTLVTAAMVPRLTMAKEYNMQIECSFDDQVFTVTLANNPSARDLLSLLPLNDLSITDYATNEKIAYLPRKLSVADAARFGNEAPGDLCYYAPWGNLAFFHAGYRWSSGLIRLGRLNDGITPLLVRGAFPLRIRSLN